MEVWRCAWRKRFPITAKRRHLHPAHGCRMYSNSWHVSRRAAPACAALCCLNYPERSHYLWQRAARLCIQQVGGTTIAAAAAAAPGVVWKSFRQTKGKQVCIFKGRTSVMSDQLLNVVASSGVKLCRNKMHHMIWLCTWPEAATLLPSLQSCPVLRLSTDTQRQSYSPAKLSRHVGFYLSTSDNMLFSHIISQHTERKLFIQIHSLISNKGRRRYQAVANRTDCAW